MLNVEGLISGGENAKITGSGILVLDSNGLSYKGLPYIKTGKGIFKIVRDNSNVSYADLEAELTRYIYDNLTEGQIKTLTTDPLVPDSTEKWGDHHVGFAFTIGKERTSLYNGTVLFPESATLNMFQWWFEVGGRGGGEEFTMTVTGATGSGIISAKNTPALIANHSLTYKVTDMDTYYNLSAYYDGEQIFSLANKLTVRFDYPVPTSDEPI